MGTPHLIRTEAVVLRRHDLGEADRIMTLYTLHLGKLRGIAKGIRRPTSRLGGHLELFAHGQIMLAHGRNLDVITQVETRNTFLGLREDLWRAGLAYYAAEALDRLTEEHNENAALFHLLVDTLERIANSRRPTHALHHFLLRALSSLGYCPELSRCVQCREILQPVVNGFSAPAGGVLCSECTRMDPAARQLAVTELKVLRYLHTAAWPEIERLRLDPTLSDEIEAILRGYIQLIAESKLKSAGFVSTLRDEGMGRGP